MMKNNDNKQNKEKQMSRSGCRQGEGREQKKSRESSGRGYVMKGRRMRRKWERNRGRTTRKKHT